MNSDPLPADPPPADDDDPLPADHMQRMLDDFFLGATTPATNHEEWLLRMAHALMEREATIVSMEQKRPPRGGRNATRGRGAWTTARPSSNA